MSNQPEALRLADALDNADGNFYAESSLWFDRKLSEATDEAAAELRRLHSINAELLDALRALVELDESRMTLTAWAPRFNAARAAISKATGEQQ